MKYWPFPTVYGIIPGSDSPGVFTSMDYGMHTEPHTKDSVLQLMKENKVNLFRYYSPSQEKYCIISGSKILLSNDADFEGMQWDEVAGAIQVEIERRAIN